MILMNHPNFNEKFYLQTDASNITLGAELYQEDEAKEHKTIAFASRTLLAAERNYTTTEKELLSIVFAVKKFRTYLPVSYTHLDVYKRQRPHYAIRPDQI